MVQTAVQPTPAGVLPSADQVYQEDGPPVNNPFSPAGVNDTMRQGWASQQEAIANQGQVAQGYSDKYDDFMGQVNDQFNNVFGGGPNPNRTAFSSNGGGSGSFIPSGAYNQAGQYYGTATDPTQFNQATGMTEGALEGVAPGMTGSIGMGNQAVAGAQPWMNQGLGATGQAMSNYGGGWNQGIANQVQGVGASFNPWNNPALIDSISNANQTLGRDFNQTVMPQMNQAAIGSGPGAYGGTRAGVAQGIREQGLADAMQRQTTDMASQGYAEGLNRYVQDRASTLGNTIDASRLGADVAMTGAGQTADIGQMLGDMGLRGAAQQAGIWSELGGLNMQQAGQIGDIANQLGNLNLGAGQGFTSQGNAETSASATVGAANAAAAASRYGADTQRNIAENKLTQANEHFWAGQMPDLLDRQFGANTAPNESSLAFGQNFERIGDIQRDADQNQIDAQNEMANQMQQYPGESLDDYIARIQYLTRPGTSGTNTSTGSDTDAVTGGAKVATSIVDKLSK